MVICQYILIIPLINSSNKQFSVYDTLKDLLISSFLIDPFFYFFHKCFHNKYLYKYHKVHHEIKNPYGFSSFYMHELDFMFGNVLPSFIPLIILSSTSTTVKIWIFITVTNTVLISHSGFDKISNFHDNHHKYTYYNYGAVDIQIDY